MGPARSSRGSRAATSPSGRRSRSTGLPTGARASAGAVRFDLRPDRAQMARAVRRVGRPLAQPAGRRWPRKWL